MELHKFIEQLEDEFEELENGTLKPETNFQDLSDWDSIHTLILIALIDTEYDVMLDGDDLSHAKTVIDLFNTVKNKLEK
jgi:acyl carrier protein